MHDLNGRRLYIIDEFDGSMCLGDYIFMSYEPDGILLRHEYGHSIQSMRQGWIYMPLTFLPSYIRCRYTFRGDSLEEYYDFFVERRANELSSKHRHNEG